MVDLVTLDDVKQHLDISRSTADAELMDYLEAATTVVEQYIGPVLPRTYVEKHAGGDRLVLFHPPVLSLAAVDRWFPNGFGMTYDVTTLMFDPDTGIVYRNNGFPFYWGPFKVTYTAGLTVVSQNVRLATLIIIAHLWKTQRPLPPKIPGTTRPEETAVPAGMSYAVPRRALELLGKRRVVIA
jgi:hypothetical protein